DRERRRRALPRREGARRPDPHPDRAARRRGAAGGDPSYARRTRVPLDSAMRLIAASTEQSPSIEVTAVARLDRRTKQLVRRLTPGDIAIVDHLDLDRVSAEELLEAGVRVVVNVAPSHSGRFPNPGPLLLVRGGVHLIDAPGAPLFEQVADGDTISVRGASIYREGARIATGRVLAADELE